MASGAPDWWIQGLIPMAWLNLVDTPGDYTLRAGLVPKVNAGEDALEFSDGKIDAHKARHKSGGADEIDISGLTPGLHETTHRSGGTDILLHSNLNPQPSDHHTKFTAANARAAINDIFGADGKADATIDLDAQKLLSGRAGFGNQAGADVNYCTQNAYYDAPNWKYIADGFAVMWYMYDVDGEFRLHNAPTGLAGNVITWTLRMKIDIDGKMTGVTSYNGMVFNAPVSVSAAAFHPAIDTQDWTFDNRNLYNRLSLDAQSFLAHVQLPQGQTVNELKLYAYRGGSGGDVGIWLYQNDLAGTAAEMATVAADWGTGYDSKVDSTIQEPVIDNDTYSYHLKCIIDPNTGVNNCWFCGAKISFA